MKPDYLTLTDGRSVRVEWNMNSLGAFTHDTGIEMTDLAAGEADIFTLRKVVWYMVIEGERLEGRTFELTEVELGSLMSQNEVIEFARIFALQASTTDQKKNTQKGRSPRIFFRK